MFLVPATIALENSNYWKQNIFKLRIQVFWVATRCLLLSRLPSLFSDMVSKAGRPNSLKDRLQNLASYF